MHCAHIYVYLAFSFGGVAACVDGQSPSSFLLYTYMLHLLRIALLTTLHITNFKSVFMASLCLPASTALHKQTHRLWVRDDSLAAALAAEGESLVEDKQRTIVDCAAIIPTKQFSYVMCDVVSVLPKALHISILRKHCGL